MENIPSSEVPEGWECVGGVAMSDFVGFGFSKKRNNVALVVSGSGRSLINCDTAENVARDREKNSGIDEWGIYCKGIDELSDESFLIAGRYGGGIPNTTCIGEWLTV